MLIGDDIVITILDSRGDGIRIGIDAPRGVKIQREEVVRAVTEANVAASQADSEAESRIRAVLGARGAGGSGAASPAGRSEPAESAKPAEPPTSDRA